MGTIFINLLKLIAIPLIIVSIIKGIVDLSDIKKFRAMGTRTFLLYVMTTVIAISVGLIMVNIISPGSKVSEDTVLQLSSANGESMKDNIATAGATKNTGPLQFLVDIVPSNFFKAASENTNMLQVIFFALFFGVALLLIDKSKAKATIDVIDGLNEAVMKMVDLIMLLAPYAVFSLLASLITEISNPDIFIALGWYMFTVIIGLVLMLVFYSVFVLMNTGIKPRQFFEGILPAQMLAFSTSSSAATLPVTMERVEEHLGVDKEVSSFVCPLGATINMDGTSLYQAVAAVFICEALHIDLTLTQQLSIILTATLASIGSAAVPGAGLIMLVIVLESLSIPSEAMAVGLALVFAVDRPLDMLRTVINITGDSSIAVIMAKKLGKLRTPHPKEITDYYKGDY